MSPKFVAPLVRAFEKLEHGAARALVGLLDNTPRPLLEWLAVEHDGDRLHPEMQLVVTLRQWLGVHELSAGSLARARARMRRDARVHAGVPIPVGAVHDLTFAGAAGPLRARHYVPRGANPGNPRPLMVFYHGGGFMLCDLDTHDGACRALCRALDVHVLSCEYRLAPEHPFPAAVEDCTAALRFAQAHAAQLGADPKRVAVAGDSAGGNLATVVTQLAKRNGEPLPVLQLLVYPAADASRDWPSIDHFAEGFFLSRKDVHAFRESYVGNADRRDPRISPLLAQDLAGLPPTVIVTAGFDPLRDEGEAYAEKLRAAGVPTKLKRMPSLIHGFFSLGAVSGAAKIAIEETAELAREYLA